jgi:hypothetical protein
MAPKSNSALPLLSGSGTGRQPWRIEALNLTVAALLALAPHRTRFTLSETFRGLILPLVGPKLPNFAPIFER